MYRRPYHNLLVQNMQSFSTFLRTPWLTVRRDNAPGVFGNPIELWNYKYRAYADFARVAQVRFLKYEDILDRPEIVFSPSDVPWSTYPRLDIPDRSLKGDARTFESFRQMYRDKFWTNAIEIEDIRAINRCLNHGILEYLNYDLAPEI